VRVLVTGPESSGTRWLTELVSTAGAYAVHRSQPEGADWIDLEAMADEFDATVVVIRGAYAHLASLTERVRPPDPAERRRKALACIAPILGRTDVHLVTYESLGSPVERRHLLAALGLDTSADVPFDDASAHRYSGQMVPDGWQVTWDGDTPVLEQ